MKFGESEIASAAGAVLAHSVRVAGRTLKKGRVLDSGDIEALQAAGVACVVVARLEPGDVPENAAAEQLAAAVCGAGLRQGAAITGRVNLFAAADGLAIVHVAAIERINAVHESLTVATVAAFAPLQAEGMVATIKVIPYAVPQSLLAAALDAAGDAALSIAPFRACRYGLAMTTLPHMPASMLRKMRAAVSGRLEPLHGELAIERASAHAVEPLAQALAQMQGAGAQILLVSGAAATVDRGDVVPAAIERAGGRVLHVGMPVDPGNLLVMGELAGLPVIGLPTCARSPKLNGLDFVLQRLAAGLPVGTSELARMGVGGLLAEIPSRPTPRVQGEAPGTE